MSSQKQILKNQFLKREPLQSKSKTTAQTKNIHKTKKSKKKVTKKVNKKTEI